MKFFWIAFFNLVYLTLSAQAPSLGLVAQFNFDSTLNSSINPMDTFKPFAFSPPASWVADRHGQTAHALNSQTSWYAGWVAAAPIDSQSRTISLWINLLGQDSSVANIITQGSAFSVDYQYDKFIVATNNNEFHSNFVALDSNWHHIAFKCDQDYAYLFMDGIAIIDSIPYTKTDTALRFWIGYNLYVMRTPNTYTDDLLIYNRALSNLEIQAIVADVPSSVRLSNLPIALPIYPNPARESFRLGLAANDQPLDVELLDLQGKRVAFYPNVQPNAELSTRELPSGVYLVRASDGRSQFSQKLVIQR